MIRIGLDLFVFALLVPGLALALAPAADRKPAVRLCLGLVAALAVLYLASFALYLARSPAGATWLLPLGVVALGAARRRQVAAFLREPEIRLLLGHWALFVLWTLALLALIVSPSGGQWTGDLWEHYERARFFLEHLPPDTAFLDHYPLTSRPPLANLVTASLMELSGRRFSDYQVHSALLSTLVFFPGWLFFRRWGGQRAGVWTLLLMLSPLIAQNTTFSWTKLPAAFFVLTGAHFLVEGLQNRGDRAARAAAFACLTLALLTHYSAGPWLLVWGLCYALWCLRSSRPLAALGELSAIAAACVLLALTWFGWAAHTYGWRGTGEANTTAAYWKLQTPAERLGTLAGNTFNTLVPHPLRKLDTSGIAQSSKLGSLRDYWFTVYQLNLPLALGFGGLLVLLHRLLRPAPPGTARAASPGLGPWPLSTIVLLGIATVTAPDRWGLCHIGLQPLVLLGLALIAAHLESAPRALVRVFSLLLCLDVAFGIVLHFWVQSLAWPAWLGGGPDDWTTASTLNSVAFTNHRYTLLHDYRTLAVDLSLGPALPAVLLACLLALVCAGLRQPKPPGLAALPRT